MSKENRTFTYTIVSGIRGDVQSENKKYKSSPRQIIQTVRKDDTVYEIRDHYSNLGFKVIFPVSQYMYDVLRLCEICSKDTFTTLCMRTQDVVLQTAFKQYFGYMCGTFLRELWQSPLSEVEYAELVREIILAIHEGENPHPELPPVIDFIFTPDSRFTETVNDMIDGVAQLY